ncbi:polyunsaturated fatty acid lipoxygenase ALOX15B-like [Leptodactylus fuscus]|uniref:polyunsaturated fatty acid lipoxygenase ALOX15B-like n=1 Tax=Leptodactylus fuscus TaxID=238119 RepID=UPI003F4EDC41
MGTFKLTVATGRDVQAGTLDSICISLIGRKGESPKKKLSHVWVPGKVSYFDVKTDVDLGELVALRLYKQTHVFAIPNAWYGEYIHITSPSGRIYQFPVYQWISGKASLLVHEGTGSILSMNDIISEHRTEQLEKERDAYKWKVYAPGVPYCIDAADITDLPYNEQFSGVKRGSFLVNLGVAGLEVVLKGLITCTDSWKNLDDIATIFCFNRTDVSDEVAQIWREDSFFGYQYLNGNNPMIIRKCLQLPENFPVSDSMVAASLGTSTDLHKELENGNIFLADYKILEGIPVNDSINGKKQYMTAPMCLLWKDPQDQLRPIAIQLGQTPGDQTPIFLPSDSEWDWMLAKMWVRNAEFQVHQTVYHLLHTHLFAEVFNIATHRQLPRNHPVFKIVIPHLRYTLDINTLARKELIGPGGVFDQIMAVGKQGIAVLLKKGMEEVTYSGLCLPDDITARGLDSIPNFFYRDDGKMIWEAMESFVSSVVQHYYKSDESVRSDPELQAWVAEIYEKGFLSNQSSGIPSSLEDVSSLVKYLTMVIFRCSAQHAAVNSGQFDFYAWMPNGPSSMKSPPPTSKGVTTLQTILDTLPDVNTTTIGLLIVWQLSKEPKDRRRLGKYRDVHFTEAAPQNYIEEFQDKLAVVSKKVIERNQTPVFPNLPYLYLDPNVIENSVSI